MKEAEQLVAIGLRGSSFVLVVSGMRCVGDGATHQAHTDCKEGQRVGGNGVVRHARLGHQHGDRSQQPECGWEKAWRASMEIRVAIGGAWHGEGAAGAKAVAASAVSGTCDSLGDGGRLLATQCMKRMIEDWQSSGARRSRTARGLAVIGEGRVSGPCRRAPAAAVRVPGAPA